jgi:hypothetical protein
MDALIIFPKFFDMNTFNSIINHIGIPKEVVEASYKLDERFILVRNSAPQYFFLGTSMTKTSNYNTILKMAYGEPETGGCEFKSDDESNFNEDDIIKILNAADFNEKDRPSALFEEHSHESREQSEPTINGV